MAHLPKVLNPQPVWFSYPKGKVVKVELWEDIVCPWCGIANERTNQALAQFEHSDEVEFVHRSFRLVTDMPDGESLESFQYLRDRKGMTREAADQSSAHLKELAREVGFDEYHSTDNQIGNTTLAHEFLAWASEQGKEREAWDLVYREYFTERAPIWTVDDLVGFAEPLGLDPAAAREALDARTYRAQVVADHDEAVELGARGVPLLVIDRKYGVSGAQSVDAIVAALEKAWSERESVSL